jgi:hypothetical protein
MIIIEFENCVTIICQPQLVNWLNKLEKNKVRYMSTLTEECGLIPKCLETANYVSLS